MFNIVEYKLTFIYKIKNIYTWCDDFKLLEEWEVLRIQKCRKIEKTYMDRSPYTKPNKNYEVALYTKNKWIYLDNGIGETNSPTTTIKVPNLEIIEIKSQPIITTYKTEFNLQIMLIICNNLNAVVLETKKVGKEKAKVLFNDTIIILYNDIIIYKGENTKEFKKICKNLEDTYKSDSKKYEELYEMIDKQEKNLYMSLAYKTWFRAKRLNQKEWPLISETPKPNSIEFRGVWYWSPKDRVRLAERKDDNDELYIPKIYKEEQKTIKNPTLPHSLKTEEYKNTKFLGWWKGEECTIINYKGEIIETDENPKYIVFDKYIIGKTNKKYKSKGKVQILDKNGKVSMIINEDNEIEQYNNVKIRNMLTVPWYYKHILHDYNKFGRLVTGEYSDLTRYGIINEKDNDTISWPDTKNLYISKSIETQRLITFKNQDNVKIKSM